MENRLNVKILLLGYEQKTIRIAHSTYEPLIVGDSVCTGILDI